MNHKKTALITGASGGIGKELAVIHAGNGGDLVIVARKKDRLDALKLELEGTCGVKVFTVGKDLSVPGAAEELYDEVKKLPVQVDYLINNAGFGDSGMFHETSWEKERRMIDLNIMALTCLTKLYLKEMVARGDGRIMNVASTAAFQPGPGMAVYFATKAFVLHFSEAVGYEVRKKGVTVTALCPGPTESGFSEAAGIVESNLFKKKVPSSRELALFGYKAMMKGKPVAIHGLKNYFLVNSGRFAPRSLVVKITGGMVK